MSETRSVRTPPWMTLDADERILLRTAPSTNLIMAAVVGGFFLMTFGSLPFIAYGSVGTGRLTVFAIIGFVLVVTLYLFLLIRGRDYVVTTKRAATASGISEKTVNTVSLDRVTDVELEQDRWHRLLSVGTLRFVTEEGPDLEFAFVGGPHFVYEQALDFTEGSTTV